MRSLFTGLISVAFIFTSSLGFAEAPGGRAWSDGYLRQYVISRALDGLMPKLNGSRNGSDLEKLLPAYFSPHDQVTLHKSLMRLRHLPKFTRLNRGIGYALNGEHYTVVVEDPASSRVRINGKADLVFSSKSSLDVQMGVLHRALSKGKFSLIDLVLPQANAVFGFDDILGAVVLGAIIGGAANKIVGDIFGEGLFEYAKDWWCEGKTEATGAATAKFCASIFAWRAKNQASSKVPEAKLTPDKDKVVEKDRVNRECPSADSPQMITTTVSDDKALQTKVTIKLNKTKPTQAIFEIKSSSVNNRLIIDINDNGSLKEVKDGDGKVVSTTDKTATSTMSPEQIVENAKRIDRANKLLKPAIAEVEKCNKMAEETIAKAAEGPGDAAVDELTLVPTAPAVAKVPVTR